MESSTVTSTHSAPRYLSSPVSITTSGLSFAERKAQLAKASMPNLVDGDDLVRDIKTPLPGDSMRTPERPRSRAALAQKRSAYFEDVFSSKPVDSPAKERLRSETTILAEVKTNVLIADEFTFITELSTHLAVRYRRPVSSIVVVLQPGACMCFGGTFEPCYVMSVCALSTELGRATNKRNAALIQKHMEESLGVIPSRGILRFIPLSEENIAINGKTVAGALENVGKGAQESISTRQILGSRRLRGEGKLNAKSLASLREVPRSGPALSTSISTGLSSATSLASMSQETIKAEAVVPPASEKKARRTKSFMAAIFGRSSVKAGNLSPVLS